MKLQISSTSSSSSKSFFGKLRMMSQSKSIKKIKSSNKNENEDEQDQTTKSSKVTFCKKVQVRPSLQLCDYTDEEIEASFYTSREYRGINRDIKSIVRNVDIDHQYTADDLSMGSFHSFSSSSSSSDGDDHNDEDFFCTRGIEFKTKAGKALIQQNRSKAMLTVLEEQDPMILMFTHDVSPSNNNTTEDDKQAQEQKANEIASAYSLQTSDSASYAYLSGLMDAKEAKNEDNITADMILLQKIDLAFPLTSTCFVSNRCRELLMRRLNSLTTTTSH